MPVYLVHFYFCFQIWRWKHIWKQPLYFFWIYCWTTTMWMQQCGIELSTTSLRLRKWWLHYQLASTLTAIAVQWAQGEQLHWRRLQGHFWLSHNQFNDLLMETRGRQTHTHANFRLPEAVLRHRPCLVCSARLPSWLYAWKHCRISVSESSDDSHRYIAIQFHRGSWVQEADGICGARLCCSSCKDDKK